MMRTISLLVCVLMVPAIGCSKKDEKKPSGKAAPGKTDKTDKAGKSSKPAVQKDTKPVTKSGAGAVEAKLTPLEKIATKLPPLKIQTKPKSIVGMDLKAERCTYDGPRLLSKSPVGTKVAVGAVAQATDGSVYVFDYNQLLRRYIPAAGAGCDLKLDKRFGKDGFLKLKSAGEWMNYRVVADAKGHVFASTGQGTYRITGRKVDYQCSGVYQPVAVTSDGTAGFFRHGSSLKKIAFTDTGCSIAAWNFKWKVKRIRRVFTVGNRVFIYDGDMYAAREFETNGNAVGEPFGSNKPGDPNRLCSVTSIQSVKGGHLILADYNCRALVFFDGKRKGVGAVKMHGFFGLNYPSVQGFSRVVKSTAYSTMIQELSKKPELHEGLIYRVRGL